MLWSPRVGARWMNSRLPLGRASAPPPRTPPKPRGDLPDPTITAFRGLLFEPVENKQE